MADAKKLEGIINDREWRLNNLYYIKDDAGRKTLFDMGWNGGTQKHFYDAIWYFNIILKARQRGFSTFVEIYMLDAMLFNENQKCGIIDASLPDAKKKLAKIRYAYEHLPDWLKADRALIKDGAEELELENGSGVSCGTSHRGDTLQKLHVSEYGKISARFPDKASEIKTGALNAVHAGQQIFIESTAEGQEGEFYELVELSRSLQESGARLTALDPKFHFYPWFGHGGYSLDAEDTAHTTITKEMDAYFNKLRVEHGIELRPGQKAWYVKKEKIQQEKMKREFPSTPDEAFEASMRGAIYTEELSFLRSNKRIGFFPWEPSLPVSTWWDLGLNDEMAIWFMQKIGMEYRFIHYYEQTDQGWGHYANYLTQLGYTYNHHNLPHDGQNRIMTGEVTSAKQEAQKVGIRPINIVTRTKKVFPDIMNHCRPVLKRCTFDEAGCEQGLKRLGAYRKKWNDQTGFMDEPLHSKASNGADAFRTFAMGDRDRKIEMIGGFEYQVPQAQQAESDYDEFEH